MRTEVARPTPGLNRCGRGLLVPTGVQEEIGNELLGADGRKKSPALSPTVQPARRRNSILGGACFPPARLLLPRAPSHRMDTTAATGYKCNQKLVRYLR